MCKRLISILPWLFYFLESSAGRDPIKTSQAYGIKGEFMAYMLHSAHFFPHTVDVKWSATAQGKPNLPVWVSLYPSKHKSIAYLIGTPVTPENRVTIHVIARQEDTFATSEKYITFLLRGDPRYNTSTTQYVEFLVKNMEPEDLFDVRNGKKQRLESAIAETFRGRFVNPYIFDVSPEVLPVAVNNPYARYSHRYQRYGSLVKIGTQRNFHPNVEKLAKDVRENPARCKRNASLPLNRHFLPEFDIDWCTLKLENVTMIKSLIKIDRKAYDRPQRVALRKTKEDKAALKTFMKEDSTGLPTNPYHFWESVLIFPLLAVLCILLVLCLSLIFFGRREGQHWRDYKTPKEQLQEYLNLRESQKHLRELSVQRQILLMNADRAQSSTPLGIRAFLQPTESESKPDIPKIMFDGSSHRSSNSRSKEAESAPLLNPRASVAKQTVADAVRATKSSLHLYRNPVDDSDDSDDDIRKDDPATAVKYGSRRTLS
uniref:CADG domain-containing protein n=1 Tax=Panagrellus redivivus TaxID=6233 RepID=A0A7E4VRM2_PANRE